MQITQVGDMPFYPFGSADYQYINPFKHLEDTPHCRTLRRLAHLIGNALVTSLQFLTQFVLRQSIHKQRQSHHHNKSHNPPGRLQKEAIGKEHGVFQETKAPLRPHSLPFVSQKDSSAGRASVSNSLVARMNFPHRALALSTASSSRRICHPSMRHPTHSGSASAAGLPRLP